MHIILLFLFARMGHLSGLWVSRYITEDLRVTLGTHHCNLWEISVLQSLVDILPPIALMQAKVFLFYCSVCGIVLQAASLPSASQCTISYTPLLPTVVATSTAALPRGMYSFPVHFRYQTAAKKQVYSTFLVSIGVTKHKIMSKRKNRIRDTSQKLSSLAFYHIFMILRIVYK